MQEKKDEDKENVVVVESPMSIVDSSILSMSISKNESQILEDAEVDTTTAQTDREMFFHVEEYRQDIYDYMRSIEVLYTNNPLYIYLLTRKTLFCHIGK